KGVGSKIEVEQCSLRPFEYDVSTVESGLGNQRKRVGDIGTEPIGVGRILGDDRLRIERIGIINPGQNEVLLGNELADARCKARTVHQFVNANPYSRRLVSVCGTDASA